MIDNLVLGSGPVGIAVAKVLSDAGRQVLVVDSGDGLRALRAATTVDSNIHYKNIRQAPSITGGSDFFWGGACMGYPDDDWGIATETPFSREDLDAAYKKVSSMLGVQGFDFRRNAPLSSNQAAALGLRGGALGLAYAYVVKDPAMRRLLRILSARQGVRFIRNAIATNLFDYGDHVRVRLLRFGTDEDLDLRARRVFLCLGTVETTRILLSSMKGEASVGLERLGTNLSDHLAIKIGAASFDGRNRWSHLVDYTKNSDGSRLWPRWTLLNQPERFKSLRGFLYFDNTISSGQDFVADINLFLEVPNSTERRIESTPTMSALSRIPAIRIRFDLSDTEWRQIGDLHEWLLAEINGLPGVDRIARNNLTSMTSLQTTSHPSGTHPAEIPAMPNVFPLSAGLLPRASATHPTLVTMALAIATVNRLLD